MIIPTSEMPQWVASFRSRFPEFKDVDDNAVANVIDAASRFVDCTWIAGDCGLALVYYAAHLLALQLLAADALPITEGAGEGGGAVIGGGQVTGIKFETLGVTFSAPKFAAEGGGGKNQGIYGPDSTPYGQYYLNLMKKSFPAVAIV